MRTSLSFLSTSGFFGSDFGSGFGSALGGTAAMSGRGRACDGTPGAGSLLSGSGSALPSVGAGASAGVAGGWPTGLPSLFHSPFSIIAAMGSSCCTGYRSKIRRCLYSPTGSRVNTCGRICAFRSNTRRTTFGRFWPTRTCLMYGSFDWIFATSVFRVGLSSSPSMSTTRRSGSLTMKCEVFRSVSFSSVTRV